MIFVEKNLKVMNSGYDQFFFLDEIIITDCDRI